MTKGTFANEITVAALKRSLPYVLGEVAAGASYSVMDEGLAIAVISRPDQTELHRAAERQAGYGSRQQGAATGTAITRLLGTRSTRDVLAVFMLDPATRVHQREIARRAGVGLRSAQIALERLEGLGLVSSCRDGNRRYYQAERTTRFEDLRAILSSEFGLSRILRTALEPFADRIQRAFIFGSTARGEDRIDSDVDLLVVGEVRGDELAPRLASVEREIGREVDLLLYRAAQFDEKRAHDSHFVTSVLAQPRVDVIGGLDDA
jgi:predicted nucleotidyltransferase/antitoxin (DNA-binding transcriptional repressor) of toxin-antitoxin stability system